jgi:urea transport system permease protein
VEQHIANILILAARYALTALGLSIIYRVSGCIDFAQGAMYLLGAYFAWLLTSACGLPLAIGLILASVCVALIGMGVDTGVYRRVRGEKRSMLGILLASFGILVVCQSAVSLVFGDVTLGLPRGPIEPGHLILGARVTDAQIGIILSATAVCFLCWIGYRRTRFGLKMEAVADNRELAAIVGVSPKVMLLLAAAIGSGLSGLAGGIISLEVDMQPSVGTEALLTAVLVVLLAGPGRMGATILASILLATTREMVGAYISFLWAEAIVLGLVLVMLAVRPRGLVQTTSRE